MSVSCYRRCFDKFDYNSCRENWSSEKICSRWERSASVVYLFRREFRESWIEQRKRTEPPAVCRPIRFADYYSVCITPTQTTDSRLASRDRIDSLRQSQSNGGVVPKRRNSSLRRSVGRSDSNALSISTHAADTSTGGPSRLVYETAPPPPCLSVSAAYCLSLGAECSGCVIWYNEVTRQRSRDGKLSLPWIDHLDRGDMISPFLLLIILIFLSVFYHVAFSLEARYVLSSSVWRLCPVVRTLGICSQALSKLNMSYMSPNFVSPFIACVSLLFQRHLLVPGKPWCTAL